MISYTQSPIRKVARCNELWASTNATEYQLNEAFENVIKHLNWDILKDFNDFFSKSTVPVRLVSSHKFIINFVSVDLELGGFDSRAVSRCTPSRSVLHLSKTSLF